MIISDLDKTLFTDSNQINQTDLETLIFLKKNNIKTAIATGRSLFSVRKVLASDFPIEYLIFSSGAGIMDWKTQKILKEFHLGQSEINRTTKVFMKYKTDFMIHEPIPNNHYFTYYQHNLNNSDFNRRVKLYRDYSSKINLSNIPSKACQMLSVFLNKDIAVFDEIEKQLDYIKVIKATSPLDHKSLWMEVFPLGVSKGHSAEWLVHFLGISEEKHMSIGNDYNDIDMLDWSSHSYIVDNAPDELKKRYRKTGSNNNNGFTMAVRDFLKKNL